jgi:ssDNA-binding Zn-finger/Zn-ribbon topoisomerase 1
MALREAGIQTSGNKAEIALRLHRHQSGYAQVKKGCSIATTAPAVPGKTQPMKFSGRTKCGDCGKYGHQGGSEQCERYTDVTGASGASGSHDVSHATARPAARTKADALPTCVDEPADGQMPEKPGNLRCPKCRAGVVLRVNALDNQRFYGCVNFTSMTRCKGSIRIRRQPEPPGL